jgi:RNA polymerase sigma-70 factor (ECF subfamily)
MPALDFRLLPFLVAAVAHLIVSALWFNAPFLFARQWLTAIAKTAEVTAAEFSPLEILYGLLAGLAVAFALDQAIRWAGVRGPIGGAALGAGAGTPLAASNCSDRSVSPAGPRRCSGSTPATIWFRWRFWVRCWAPGDGWPSARLMLQALKSEGALQSLDLAAAAVQWQIMRVDAARIEEVFRQHYGRVMANLIARFHDFDLAEEALAEAWLAAVERWQSDGLPENPAGWLTTTARRKAIDRLRRDRTYQQKLEEMGRETDLTAGMAEGGKQEAYPDERLKLIFTCCHPALSTEAQIALTLKSVAGLSTEAIAGGFLVKETAMAQRLVRAKRKILQAAIPFRVPDPKSLDERLHSVLAVIYLIFNEGYFSASGRSLVHADLTAEAIQLASLLVRLLTDEGLEPLLPEALGLKALLLLQDSRREARTDAEGDLVRLSDQDRSRWNRLQIDLGLEELDRALRMASPGQYQNQAAIAAIHCQARTFEDTDWPQIVVLYRSLYDMHPTPVIRLNLAVALAMAGDVDAARLILEGIEAEGSLSHYSPFHAAWAHVHEITGNPEAAMRALKLAAGASDNQVERRHYNRQASSIASQVADGQEPNPDPRIEGRE